MPSTPFDRRRRRYVPLDVTIAFGRFGTLLIDRWGIEGIGTWMLFLAACKREQNEGIFTYTTDAEAWGKLGATASGFTLEEFWRFTGQHKKTSRRRHGRLSYVTCTVWEAWNTRPGAAQNPSKPPTNTDELRETAEKYDADPSLEVDLEVDLEGEREKDKDLAPKNGATNPAVEATEIVRAENGQTLVALFVDTSRALGSDPPARVKGQVAKQVGEMLKEGVDPARVAAGIDLMLQRHTHPSTLPSMVHEAGLPPRRRNGKVTPTELMQHALRLERDEALQLERTTSDD